MDNSFEEESIEEKSVEKRVDFYNAKKRYFSDTRYCYLCD